MQTSTIDHSINIAFAHGALDGYSVGLENNPYEPKGQAALCHAYKTGYEYGVFLCTQDNSSLQGDRDE